MVKGSFSLAKPILMDEEPITNTKTLLALSYIL